MRFHQHGWKIMYTPDAEIIHVLGGSSSQRTDEMIICERRSTLMLMQQKSGWIARAVANGMFLAGALARVIVLGLGSLLLGRPNDVAQQRWTTSTSTLAYHALGRLPSASGESTFAARRSRVNIQERATGRGANLETDVPS